jgi:hypothetical protein
MSACGLPLLGDDANYGDIPGLIRTIALAMKRGKNVDFTGYWQPLPAMIPQGQIDDPDQSMNAKKRPQPGGLEPKFTEKCRGRNRHQADVGSQPADPIKFAFRRVACFGGEGLVHVAQSHLFFLVLPNELPETFCGSQTCRAIVVLQRDARIGVM